MRRRHVLSPQDLGRAPLFAIRPDRRFDSGSCPLASADLAVNAFQGTAFQGTQNQSAFPLLWEEVERAPALRQATDANRSQTSLEHTGGTRAWDKRPSIPQAGRQDRTACRPLVCL